MTAPYRFVSVEREGRILVVTIRRPEVSNALHGPSHQELATAFDAFAADDSLLVAILAGEGATFCAGDDRATGESGEEQGLPKSGFGGLTSRFDNSKTSDCCGERRRNWRRIRARACLRSDRRQRNRGVRHEPSPGGQSVAGWGRASLGPTSAAEEGDGRVALGPPDIGCRGSPVGVCSIEIVPPGAELSRATEMAAEILRASPSAIRGTKQSALGGLTLGSVEAASNGRYPAVESLLESGDAREADLARREGRDPRWFGA